MSTFFPAHDHLQKSDPVMAKLVAQFGPLDHTPSPDIFKSLVYSIIEQQLSVKAAQTIFSRFENLFPDKNISPQQILALELGQIRAVGTSWAKARSLHDLSQKMLDGVIRLHELEHLPDDDIIAHLVQVKGIGIWSAQMRLMFSFGRQDVFPATDVGIQNAMALNYGLNKKLKSFPQKMLKIASVWRPYRTLACLYLWSSLDNQP